MIDYLEIYDVLQSMIDLVLIYRMWIVYNNAPYDNGHPIGEEVQVGTYHQMLYRMSYTTLWKMERTQQWKCSTP